MRFSSPLFFCLLSVSPSWAQLNPGQSASKSLKPATKTEGGILHTTSANTLASTTKNTVINQNGQTTLVWGKPYTDKLDENSDGITFLNCKNALYTKKNHYLPSFFKHIKLNGGSNLANASIINTKYEALTVEEVKALGTNKEWVNSDITPQVKIVIENHQFYANVLFTLIRKNTLTDTYEKLISFSLDVHQTKEDRKPNLRSTVNFASSSVLSTGTWFRIGVAADGIYKLDYSFFLKAGIDTAKLIPADIRIYGNGGAMLPQSNAVHRPDDLLENAIYVQGQKDISFKKNDYVLFYGQSPHIWAYSTSDNRFHHTVNVYSDTTFYFVNIDLGPGKRINTEQSITSTPTNTVTTFDDYAYHELDAVNLIQSGNEWMGEYFEATTQYTISFNFPNLYTATPVYVNASIASRDCNTNSTYQVVSQGGGNASCTIPPTLDCVFTNPYAYMGSCNYTYTAGSGSSNVSVTVTKETPGAVGWLYYVETNVRRQLIMGAQNQMEFRDSKSFGAGNTSLFNISSFANVKVWDVTNPQNVDSVTFLHSGNGSFQFSLPNDSLKQFVAFTGSSYNSPLYFGKVGNQNLHGMPQADLIIVTNSLYMSQAKQLAEFHTMHDSLKVNVVTTQQVYNEFSSGLQDPTAIRDFARMFYDRAGNSYANSPKYLLLFGEGSFDPKHRISGNTNYVIAYESSDSFDPAGGSYVSDDYFGLLDSTVTTPPEDGAYSIDLSIGRIPADNVPEAQACVNKIIAYETPSGQSANALTKGQNLYNLGNWRNTICFIAHDGEEDQFQTATETMTAYVDSNYKNLNVNKIYFDAYPMEQTPGGARYPSVNAAIDNQMNQGLLIYNYEGHGGPTGLGLERVLDFTDIYSWTNASALPLFFNGSCAFGEWDNPLQISGGAISVTLPTGGVIGMMSATREVFLGPNVSLNNAFINFLYSPLPDGSLPRMGDLLVESKNATGETDINNLSFSLLGDPAVRLNYPKYNVYTTSVSTQAPDTLKALAKVTVSGYIGDGSGNPLANFNGLLNPTVYDKYVNITTLSNLGDAQSPPMTFSIQNSELYKGLISIKNGRFTFTYVMPKDILYYYGYGKISYYAQNGTTDAAGNDEKVVIGGTSPTAHNNGIGPRIKLYMNDSNFVYGGLTNQNPSLFATIFDSNGINTSGTSIGHDITAVLDNNTANTYDLTNYYQPSLNSYQKGTITFPFSSLSNGTHTLSLRVWNVYDNTTIVSTEFNVASQSNLQLQHVLNYPDPFTTHTQFFFEVNEVNDQMDVQIQIFSVSGKLVRNILTSVKTDSFRSQPIDWDGRDDYGDKIAKGVYIYHIKVRTTSGATADTYQKLVIL